MRYIDIKTIEGKCGGFGSWMGNALSSPAPGDIFYYKTHHHGHHGHHGHHQRGGSRGRTKSRKYVRKSNSKSKTKRNIRRNRKY